jgi:two-component system sensor histidine kinase VanS
VVGYLSLLDEAPDLPEAQRQKYVSTALAKAETLDSLTTEFFEITRYNLSSIPIERDEVEVQLFLEQLASDFLPELQGRGLAVRVAAPPCKTMFADGGKMARAVGNVIRTAIA